MNIFLSIYFEIQRTFGFKNLRMRFIRRMFFFSSYIYLHTAGRFRNQWKINTTQLMNYPSNSLGNLLAVFLQENKLELQPRAENHDIFHLLTGYSTSVKDEIALQYFLLGNGKTSPFLLLAIVAGTLLLPENWSYYRLAYNKGKSATAFHHWNFYRLLQKDFTSIYNKIYNNH